jgi:hypothetical protein
MDVNTASLVELKEALEAEGLQKCVQPIENLIEKCSVMVETWTKDEVIVWLENVGLPTEQFRFHEIAGLDLLELTRAQLLSLGIEQDQIPTFERMLQQLRENKAPLHRQRSNTLVRDTQFNSRRKNRQNNALRHSNAV